MRETARLNAVTSRADTLTFCWLVTLAVIYVLIEMFIRRELPRLAARLRSRCHRPLRMAALFGTSPRLKRAAASRRPVNGRYRGTQPRTTLIKFAPVLHDPLAVERGVAPWDRLNLAQQRVWFAAIEAHQPEPWFGVAETGSFAQVS